MREDGDEPVPARRCDPSSVKNAGQVCDAIYGNSGCRAHSCGGVQNALQLFASCQDFELSP